MRKFIAGVVLGAAVASAISVHAQATDRSKRANARQALRNIAVNVKAAGNTTTAQQRENMILLLTYIELSDAGEAVEPPGL